MKINDWLKNDDLSAKILICSDVKNGTRVIRKWNKNGICRVNTECKHMSDIARDIIIGNSAKNGRLVPFKLLDDSACAVIIDRIIRNNFDKLPFFQKGQHVFHSGFGDSKDTEYYPNEQGHR